MNLTNILTTVFLSLFLACGNLNEVLESVETISTPTEDLTPTTEEMGLGLKDALIKGTKMGVDQLNKSGGYMNDPEVKIPFPKDLMKVKNTLIDMGLESQVDRVVSSLNSAAEDAVIKAKPIFVNAITDMSIQDAKNILFGSDTAATSYLKSKTSSQLNTAFKLEVQSSLDKVNATKYWDDVIGTYNKIPLVDKVNEDLSAYVTDRAIEGLFYRSPKKKLPFVKILWKEPQIS